MKVKLVISVLVVLVAVVAGCGGSHRYDSRLVLADSLMQANPDSALALVEAVDADSLSSEGDHAYRDLLLTQARYKCYITATSDSAINRSLAYYRRHKGEREKLTRAYIYKGAVMEELGHPDSAMFYYKTAEATADPTDYFNRGYSNMRMASLYCDQLSQDTTEAIHLQKAIYDFELIKDTNNLISCYGLLGGVYGDKQPDSCKYYLTRAIELAVHSKSTKQYTYKSKLAGLYYYHYQDYLRSKDMAMDVMRNGREYSKETQFFYYAALSFIKLGMLDSAKYVLHETPAPIDAVDSMNRHQVIADIAKAEKDLAVYNENLIQSKENQIQIISAKNDHKLKAAENDFSIKQAEQREAATKVSNQNLMFFLAIAIAMVIVLIWLTNHLKHILKRKDEENKQTEKALMDTIQDLQDKQQQLQQRNLSVSELVGDRIEALNELFDSIKFKSNKESQDRIRRIIPLSSLIFEMENAHRRLNTELSDRFWEKMKRSVDAEFNGIVSYVEKNYPNLSINELRIFCLMCAKFSPQIIKLCLNRTSAKSISNYRVIIIKRKMGLDMTLEEFIDKYMKNEL